MWLTLNAVVTLNGFVSASLLFSLIVIPIEMTEELGWLLWLIYICSHYQHIILENIFSAFGAFVAIECSIFLHCLYWFIICLPKCAWLFFMWLSTLCVSLHKWKKAKMTLRVTCVYYSTGCACLLHLPLFCSLNGFTH